MQKNQIPELSLSSGHKMPVIGLGTVPGTVSPPPPETLTSIFLDAIDAGYRHFDTAATYGSEEPLGRAVGAAVEKGLIKNRDEVFITSKLWCNNAHCDLVLPALKKTLKKLGLEYVDLYLIHFPVRLKQEAEGYEFPKEHMLPFDIKGTWEAMEQCSRLGLAKSIGVSNFGTKKLSQLLQHATIPPVVNQVEMNVAWQQGKLLEFCKNNGIYLNAWAPLGANGAHWGSLRVMESPTLKEIAAAKGKTVPQVALRWIYEQGAGIIVKSFSKERMKQNLQIFEWELSQEDLEKIKQIPQLRGYSGEMFIYKDGPYKTFEELWDDDA